MDNYKQYLEKSGFSNVKLLSKNREYRRYNQDVIDRLLKPENKQAFINQFGASAYAESIEGYQCIVTAIDNQELLITQITAIKSL